MEFIFVYMILKVHIKIIYVKISTWIGDYEKDPNVGHKIRLRWKNYKLAHCRWF